MGTPPTFKPTPIPAKINPTSPLGTIPRATVHRSMGSGSETIPPAQAILPAKATKESARIGTGHLG